MVFPQRMTAEIEGSYVVFLIGMRINRPHKFWKWLPVMGAMPRMMKELTQQKEKGLLHSEVWFGRTVITLQYWRSVEQLMEYATASNSEHLPAWREFNQKVGNSGDVGIWHETYIIHPGNWETVYINMPRFGLAQAGNHVPAAGHKKSASARLNGKEPVAETP